MSGQFIIVKNPCTAISCYHICTCPTSLFRWRLFLQAKPDFFIMVYLTLALAGLVEKWNQHLSLWM